MVLIDKIFTKLAPIVANLISPHMRSPGNGIGGWLAMRIMTKANPESIRHSVRRLHVQPTDTVVELGPGHGFGLRAIFEQGPRRYIGVEISDKFREKLEVVKQELLLNASTSDDNKNQTCGITAVDIYGDDAKDMSGFLQNASVDMIFGMNVVYFLDPLEEYLREFDRVLVPGGTVVFGGKFSAVKNLKKPFVNTQDDAIVEQMKAVGYDVTSTAVDVGGALHNYVELKGVKPLN